MGRTQRPVKGALLERVRAMGHAIWLPNRPRSCNIGNRDLDSSKPHSRAHEDRRPSLDVDARTHPVIEQDMRAASAALLEGEGKEDAEREQQADCCARHTLVARHRHACRLGGHIPATQVHTHTRAHTLVHRAQLSVGDSGAPPWHPTLASRLACKPLGPSTQTKQGE